MGQLLGCGSQQVSAGLQQIPAQDLHSCEPLEPKEPHHCGAQGLPGPCSRRAGTSSQPVHCPLPQEVTLASTGWQVSSGGSGPCSA